ncbi:MAG: BTAD domain-containing putative transcriptional regulator [Betaproteobacteria bacterium]
MKPAVPFAKLTRPRLFTVTPRERLFALLGVERPVVWVAGPPGAGKTTLVASYLDARALEGIWYQADASDGDPSTFFYYVGLAGNGAGASSEASLPLLTPDYLPDLHGFSRRFFRALFSRLPRHSVLVIDNFQEIAAESVVPRLIEEAVAEIPDRVAVIIISRTEPPPSFAHSIASDRVQLVGWHDLQLTREETHEVTRLRLPLDDPMVTLLHERCDGWAAGLTLMLERLRRSGTATAAVEAETREAVFDYFAGEFYECAPMKNRITLAATALLPHMTEEMAAAISGNADAGKLLDYLYRRHLFTDRRLGSQTIYQYHALFREFLLARAREMFGVDGVAELSAKAAGLLEAAGQIEHAIALLAAARAWTCVVEILQRHARTLLAQGRGQTMRQWIALLPESLVQAQPWLAYWFGISLAQSDFAAARRSLEVAFDGFRAAGEVTGQTLSASGMIDSYYFEWREDHPLDHWIAVMADLLAKNPRFENGEDELKPYMSIVAATVRRCPGHPILVASIEHVMRMLATPLEPNAAINAAGMVLNYIHFVADLDLLNRVMRAVALPLKNASVTPPTMVHWLGRLSFCLHRSGADANARSIVDRAIALAKAHGLPQYLGFLYLMRCHTISSTGNVADMRSTVREFEAIADSTRALERNALCRARSKLALLEKDYARLVVESEAAIRLIDQAGLICVQIWNRMTLAATLAVVERTPEALTVIAQARRLLVGTPFVHLKCEFALIEAWIALRDGDRTSCHTKLRAVLAPIKARHMAADYLSYAPAIIRSSLFAEALREGIETETVRDIIRRYSVPAPPDDRHWAWPLKIYMLGRFEVLVHEVPLTFGRKLPRKALRVLKLVAAHGGKVSDRVLMDMLWPDEDGDVAYQLLTATLYRLRKLLGSDEVLRQYAGTVCFDNAHCWLDVAAFERSLEIAGSDKDADHLAETVRLYGGPLLPDDDAEPWVAALRARLNKRFVHIVVDYGARLESIDRCEDAIRCYLNGIQADNVSEPLYQGLIRCYERLGRQVDAIRAYETLRGALAEKFNARPSRQTDALLAALRARHNSAELAK